MNDTSIKRVFGNDSAMRWATFHAGESQLCSVCQWADAAATPVAMRRCFIFWTNNQPGGETVEDAVLCLEAMRRAVGVAQRWNEDAGKPAKEILQ